MKPRLIGLAGPAQAGKSTAGLSLVRLGYVRLRFADPIKAALRAILEASGMHPTEVTQRLDGDLKEEPVDVLLGVSARYAMQTLGTEWGRQIIGFDLWTRITMNQAGRIIAEGGNVVIDDVRFWEEAEAIRGNGGMLIEITRPGFSYSASHASEGGLSKFDLSLENDGDEEALGRKLQQVIAGS